MISRLSRQLAARLPAGAQQELRRLKLIRQFANGRLGSDEPEFRRVAEWLRPGDFAIDVGANVGAYTMAMSQAVGPDGRVFAFEPIPETFEILASIARRASNVTLFNAAIAAKSGIVRFQTPTWENGLPNYYESSMQETGTRPVFALELDSLVLPAVSLVKIDAEGAELLVLQGMEKLLTRDHPLLIVEGGSRVSDYLSQFGYGGAQVASGSPNAVFQARNPA